MSYESTADIAATAKCAGFLCSPAFRCRILNVDIFRCALGARCGLNVFISYKTTSMKNVCLILPNECRTVKIYIPCLAALCADADNMIIPSVLCSLFSPDQGITRIIIRKPPVFFIQPRAFGCNLNDDGITERGTTS